VAALILASALAAKLSVVAAVLGLGALLGMLSRLPFTMLARRVWLPVLPFSAILAAPALFLTPGTKLYWEITAQGARTAGFLLLRAESAATLALVLVFTTPWMHVLKALRMFRVPVVFVVVLGMACRYILLLLESAHEMFESRKSRTVGALTRGEQRRIAILSSGALLSRTFQLSDEVYLAMQARGFQGEVYIVDDFSMTGRDWTALIAFSGLAMALAWAGR
jgi:energy-coupling factor transporter transmembrane protein EcfT